MTDEEFEAALAGMSVQTIEVVRLPGWEPKPACCHENVDAWVRANPGSKSIRGWLIQGGCDPTFIIAAHSIVQRRDGSLIDITWVLELSKHLNEAETAASACILCPLRVMRGAR